MNDLISIDLGNSNPHVLYFKNGKKSWTKNLNDFLKSWSCHDTTPIILTSVRKNFELPKGLLKNAIYPQKNFKHGKFFDMQVNYSETLGGDRLIQAYYLYKNSELPCLLIDSGTFTKIDYVSSAGFLGGHIFPGVHTFLNTYRAGDNLPAIHFKDMDSQWQSGMLPQNTKDAIEKSCHLYHSMLIQHFLKKFPNKKIILSGGQADYIANFIETENYEISPDLIHLAHLFLYQQHYATEKKS